MFKRFQPLCVFNLKSSPVSKASFTRHGVLEPLTHSNLRWPIGDIYRNTFFLNSYLSPTVITLGDSYNSRRQL